MVFVEHRVYIFCTTFWVILGTCGLYQVLSISSYDWGGDVRTVKSCGLYQDYKLLVCIKSSILIRGTLWDGPPVMEMVLWFVSRLSLVFCIKSYLVLTCWGGSTMWYIVSHSHQLLQVSFKDKLPLGNALAYDYMTRGNIYNHPYGIILLSMIWYDG